MSELVEHLHGEMDRHHNDNSGQIQQIEQSVAQLKTEIENESKDSKLPHGKNIYLQPNKSY